MNLDERIGQLAGMVQRGFDEVTKRLNHLDDKVERLDGKIERLDERVERGFDEVNHRFDNAIQPQLDSHARRIKELEIRGEH